MTKKERIARKEAARKALKLNRRYNKKLQRRLQRELSPTPTKKYFDPSGQVIREGGFSH